MKRGPVTPFIFVKVDTPPLLEYVALLPPSARAVSTDRTAGSSSFLCRFSGTIHPFSTRPQKTHSDSEPDPDPAVGDSSTGGTVGVRRPDTPLFASAVRT